MQNFNKTCHSLLMGLLLLAFSCTIIRTKNTSINIFLNLQNSVVPTFTIYQYPQYSMSVYGAIKPNTSNPHNMTPLLWTDLGPLNHQPNIPPLQITNTFELLYLLKISLNGSENKNKNSQTVCFPLQLPPIL